MKRLSDQTLYEILEVSVEAPPEEVERAYERAKALYGPGSLATYTLMSTDEATLLNNRIEEAKVVLLDPDARSRYDERIGVRPRSAPIATPPPVHAGTPWPPPIAPGATPVPEAAVTSTTAAPPPPAPAQLPIVLQTPIATPPPGSLPELEPPPADPGPSAAPPPAVAPAAAGEPATPPSPGVPALAPSLPPLAAPPAPALAAPAPSPAAAPAPPAGPAAPAPIPLKHELAAPKDLLVPEGAAWTGEMLRQVREARGLTLPQISERTKITRHHLENIEADRFGALPAPVYLRGILMSLARELRLDGQKVSRSFLERMAAALAAAPKK